MDLMDFIMMPVGAALCFPSLISYTSQYQQGF